MLSVTHPSTLPMMTLQWTLLHCTISFLFPMTGVTTWWFALDSSIVNGYLTYHAWRFFKEPTDAHGRKMFFATLWYLPAILLVMLVHHISMTPVEEEEESTTGAIVADNADNRIEPEVVAVSAAVTTATSPSSSSPPQQQQ
jgi:hypothetical protein